MAGSSPDARSGASAAMGVTPSIVEGEQLGSRRDGLVVILIARLQLVPSGRRRDPNVEGCGVQGGQPDGLVVILDGGIQFPLAAGRRCPVLKAST